MQTEINSNQLPNIPLPKINDPSLKTPEEPKPKTEPALPQEIDGKSNTQCYDEYCKLYFTNIVLTNQVYLLSRLKYCSEKKMS